MPDNDCLPAGKANGSSNRLVADIDNQSKEVEDGIAAALCQSLPLLSTVIRDAAAQTTSPVCPITATLLLLHFLTQLSHSGAPNEGSCHT